MITISLSISVEFNFPNCVFFFSLEKSFGKKIHFMMMDTSLGNHDLSATGAKSGAIGEKNDGEKLNKCNQCGNTFSRSGALDQHVKTHSGEKLNKCNQCDFASSRADSLRTHLKIHSGEKSNKCKQCDFASTLAGN